MDPLAIAKTTIEIEAEALIELRKSIDERFSKSIELLRSCTGRVVITGIGKSAIIGQKIVATLNSTGTHSVFMHAADAVHGDLGMIAASDILICISKSGETAELKLLVPILRSYDVKIIAMTASMDSYLALHSDSVLYTPVSQEADPNRLAPTTSTTVQSSMGDAVAIVLLTMKGFTPSHFAKFHPGGSLGKQLYLKVSDLTIHNKKPSVGPDAPIKEILLNMSANLLGATVVVDTEERILGIITDGDIRRWFQEDNEKDGAFAQKIMTSDPLSIDSSALAIDAFQILRDKNISQLPVISKGIYTGMVHVNDFLREGFV